MKKVKAVAGEFIGTFLMCFLGIGAVATATLFGAMTGPGQVGLIWAIAIAVAIYGCRNLSYAHFNPAVSVAMVVSKRMKLRELPIYLLGQFLGAFAAGLLLWVLFADSVYFNLAETGGSMSVPTAASSIWCEVTPNNAAGVVTPFTGALAEGIGTFLLIMLIFSLTEKANVGRPSNQLAPLFIGLTVYAIICTIGPLTDCGINPARDIGPRLVACIVGFGSIAFSWEVILIYTVGPIVGAVLAAFVYTKLVEKMHTKCTNDTSKPCNPNEKHCRHSKDEPCDKFLQMMMEKEDKRPL